MKARRRFITSILAAVLCLSFTAGCGSSGTSQNKEESKTSVNAEESSKNSTEEKSNEDNSTEEKSNEESIGEEKEADGMHTLFIRDAGKNSKMTAGYRFYKGAWIFERDPHTEQKLRSEEVKSLFSQGGLMIRNAYDFMPLFVPPK